jgi:hypothetical protein
MGQKKDQCEEVQQPTETGIIFIKQNKQLTSDVWTELS